MIEDKVEWFEHNGITMRRKNGKATWIIRPWNGIWFASRSLFATEHPSRQFGSKLSAISWVESLES